MKFRTTPLLTTLFLALSLGLSPLIFAANPVQDDNYTYNGKRYYANSTGGVKKAFRISKAHKRSKKSRGSVKFIVFTQNCVRGNASDLYDDDCDRGVRRSQLEQYDRKDLAHVLPELEK